MTGRFRKKPTTVETTSEDQSSPSKNDSNSTVEHRKAPNSPIRNIFKKKRPEIETYQELEETVSSDNNDSGNYLPSTLRFEGIKNFSPTKSLEGIQQFDANANTFLESFVDDNSRGVESVEYENQENADEVVDNAKDTNDIQETEMDASESNLIQETDNMDIPCRKDEIVENHMTHDEQIPTDRMTSIPSENDNWNEMTCGESEAVACSTDVISTLSTQELATIPQDQKLESKQITSESNQSSSDIMTLSSSTNSDLDISPTANKKPVEGILRSSTAEVNKVSTTIPNPSVGDSHQLSNNHLGKNYNDNKNKKKGSKKAVSFADENGGIISELQTIDVSPSKLSRKIRRGKSLPAGYDYFEDEDYDSSSKSHNGVMGRVLVLLMDPPTKQYELTSVPYPLVSNEDGVVGPTKLKVILDLVATSASYEPLRLKKYKGFMRPDDSEMMENERTILDYKFVKDEVLVAIPEGYGVDECSRFSKPILQDKRLVKLLKRLKRHERKAEKKRRLKVREGMKPSHYGLGRDGTLQLGGETRLGNGMFGDGILVSTLRFIGIICILLLVISILLGAGEYIQEKKAQELLLLAKTAKEQNPSCARGSFCNRPFGVKQNVKEQDKAFLAKLRDGIRSWKLESDDLML